MVEAEKDRDDGPPDGLPEDDVCVVLDESVSYVRGWMEAAGAVAALRDELTASGLDARLAGMRAEVTVAGVGVVELGRISPATARLLAGLLATARQTGARQTGARQTGARQSGTGEASGRGAENAAA